MPKPPCVCDLLSLLGDIWDLLQECQGADRPLSQLGLSSQELWRLGVGDSVLKALPSVTRAEVSRKSAEGRRGKGR